MRRCIAFDLDGVLVDADVLHQGALNWALAQFGPQAVISKEEHLRVFKGLPTRVKLEMLVEAGRLRQADLLSARRMKQEETVRAVRRLRPDPEKHALLSWLQDDGWEIAVCSNAVRESVFEMLLSTQLISYVAFYLSNEDGKPKPDPDLYLRAAALLRVPPEDLVVVEDAVPGREAARRAGCRLVEVEGPEEVDLTLLMRIYAAADKKRREAMLDKPMTVFKCWKCGRVLKKFEGEKLIVSEMAECPPPCGEPNALDYAFPRAEVETVYE